MRHDFIPNRVHLRRADYVRVLLLERAAMTHPIIQVEWEDSSSTNRVWNQGDYLAKQKNQRCMSIGFLVHEDEHCVVIAGHMGLDEHPDFSGDMRIPKSAIRKRKKVKL